MNINLFYSFLVISLLIMNKGLRKNIIYPRVTRKASLGF